MYSRWLQPCFFWANFGMDKVGNFLLTNAWEPYCWDSDTLIKSEGMKDFCTSLKQSGFSKFSPSYLHTRMFCTTYCKVKCTMFCTVLMKLKSFFAICSTNEIMDLMEYGLQLSSVEITQLVSANVNGEIAMKAIRKLLALPYFLPL